MPKTPMRGAELGSKENKKPKIGVLSRPCPKCSGNLILKRKSSTMRIGHCEKCGRTYALI